MTKENARQLAVTLLTEELPRTYRDAISLTRVLGYRYLWIDAICIIQDDEDDWEKESKNIGEIFANAVCTLAAVDAVSDSSSTDSGLFLERKDPLCVVKLPVLLDNHSRSDIFIQLQSTGFHSAIDESTWNKRGWVVQERILSRRILYFTAEKLFWQCQTEILDEQNTPLVDSSLQSKIGLARELLLSDLRTLSEGIKPTSTPDDGGSLGDEGEDEDDVRYRDIEPRMFSQWWKLIEYYSNSQLTFAKDKMMAITGLFEVVSQRIKVPQLCGTWGGSGRVFTSALLWRAKQDFLTPYQDFRTNSWSWAALEGQVTFSAPSSANADGEDFCFYYTPMLQTGFGMNFKCPRTERRSHVEHRLKFYSPCFRTRSSASDTTFSSTEIYTSRLSHLDGFPQLGEGENIGDEILKCFEFKEHCESFYKKCEEKRDDHLPEQARILLSQDGTRVGWMAFDQDRDYPDLLCLSLVLQPSPQMASQEFQELKRSQQSTEITAKMISEAAVIDVLALEQIPIKELDLPKNFFSEGSKHLYRRVGRGRVVKKVYNWKNVLGYFY
jgi:Heterokaryon incompatibility protein (HET)